MNDDDDDKSDRCPTTRTMLYFNMLGFADRGLTAPVYRAQYYKVPVRVRSSRKESIWLFHIANFTLLCHDAVLLQWYDNIISAKAAITTT